MKLVKEVVPEKPGYPRRYLLLEDVTESDSKILSLCNMEHKTEFDIIAVDSYGREHNQEAWMVM